MSRMSDRRRNRAANLLCLLLFAITFVALLPGIRGPVNTYDEGIVTVGATRVMAGDVPYRDFWTVYGPGQFYALAAAFRLFGTSVLVERLWDTLCRSLAGLFAYFLARRFASRRTALAAWAVETVWLGYYGNSHHYAWAYYGYPVFPAVAGSFASMWMAARYLEQRRGRWMVASGIAVGVAALFRQDIGIYAGVTLAAAIAWFNRLRRSTAEARPPTPGIRPALEGMPLFAVGILLVLGPVGAFLLARVPFGDLIHDLITFPISGFPRVRALPYPRLNFPGNLPFYLPFPVLAAACAAAAAAVQARRSECVPRALCLFMLVVFALLSFNQARIRADLIHTPSFFLPSLLLLAALPGEISRSPARIGIAGSRVLSCIAALCLGALLIRPVGDRIELLTAPAGPAAGMTRDLPRARGISVPDATAQVVRAVQELAAPGEPIYVGNASHDRILESEPMIYFLAGRACATRYHELHPGVATTAPVQREIADQLEERQVRVLVLSGRFENLREPNGSSKSSGVRILDDYIARHYRPEEAFGPYTIWSRI